MSAIVRGSAAGVIATVLMSVVVFGGKLMGLLQTPPPKQITANAQEQVGVNPAALPDEVFHVSWLAAHVGYGAAAGVLYALVRSLIPGPTLLRGLIYGGVVWAASYKGLLPALGLYPSAEDDSTSRQAVMIAAHAVYGSTLAISERSLP